MYLKPLFLTRLRPSGPLVVDVPAYCCVCNRPDLIARVFEAKSGNKRHAGCFGNECKMNGFCFFAVFRIVFS
ncbi:BQ5605_C004g02671 [Microbotryum silenes-dioicae]|uniref:BQ5605_C004g02671 protein n=1 Tax=Microbotryum silenes-dioicae TaxID=796604 RepID=A0A2X0P420_9BASI|nr:BQ5605_C004g02671 [Microbotryum silenes-dioicae]